MDNLNMERVGVVNEDGSRTLPKFDVHGQPYVLPPLATLGLDDTHFVVLSGGAGITVEQAIALVSEDAS